MMEQSGIKWSHFCLMFSDAALIPFLFLFFKFKLKQRWLLIQVQGLKHSCIYYNVIQSVLLLNTVIQAEDKFSM